MKLHFSWSRGMVVGLALVAWSRPAQADGTDSSPCSKDSIPQENLPPRGVFGSKADQILDVASKPTKLRCESYGSLWGDVMYGRWQFGAPLFAIAGVGIPTAADRSEFTFFYTAGASLSSGLLGDRSDRVSIGMNFALRQITEGLEKRAKSAAGDGPVNAAINFLKFAGNIGIRFGKSTVFAKATWAKFSGVRPDAPSENATTYDLPYGATRGLGTTAWKSDYYRGEIGVGWSGTMLPVGAFFWWLYPTIAFYEATKIPLQITGPVFIPLAPYGCLAAPFIAQSKLVFDIPNEEKQPNWVGGGCSAVFETYSAPFLTVGTSFQRMSIVARGSFWLNDPFLMKDYPESGFSGYLVLGSFAGGARMKSEKKSDPAVGAYVWGADIEAGPWFKIGRKQGIVIRAYGRAQIDTLSDFFGKNQFSSASTMIWGAGLATGVRL